MAHPHQTQRLEDATHLFLQLEELDDRDAGAALVEGRVTEGLYAADGLEIFADFFTQDAVALAVEDGHLPYAHHQGVVHKMQHLVDGVVDSLAPHVDRGGEVEPALVHRVVAVDV